MRIRLFSLFFLCTATIVQAQRSLENQINELLQSDLLSSSEVGISVFNLTTDEMMYSYQSAKRYNPASTQKLVTSVAALHFLTPDYSVPTTLYHDGTVKEGVLQGNLYVTGGFDSEFGTDEMNQLVQILSSQGIHTIEGQIYGDLSMKDSVPYGAGWCWDDSWSDYQPVLSPLLYHKGFVNVRATPSRKGEPAQISVYPAANCYRIENLTRSNDSEAGLFRVTRNLFTSSPVITVSGNVTGTQNKNMTIPRPHDLFMSVFMQQLDEKGIRHAGFGGYRECPLFEAVQMGATRRPLQDVIRRALKVSDNLSAEALFYQVASYWKGGRYASAGDAINAINTLIMEIGCPAVEYEIADGSGLSRYNYLSPDLLVRLLRFVARNQELMNVVYPALPVAGVDGTLRNRMKNGSAYNNVRAKTGTITGASSLAGYLTASNGHIIAFAIMNQNMKNGRDARAFQDRLCEILCR